MPVQSTAHVLLGDLAASVKRGYFAPDRGRGHRPGAWRTMAGVGADAIIAALA
jgi:hypothetical protein